MLNQTARVKLDIRVDWNFFSEIDSGRRGDKLVIQFRQIGASLQFENFLSM